MITHFCLVISTGHAFKVQIIPQLWLNRLEACGYTTSLMCAQQVPLASQRGGEIGGRAEECSNLEARLKSQYSERIANRWRRIGHGRVRLEDLASAWGYLGHYLQQCYKTGDDAIRDLETEAERKRRHELKAQAKRNRRKGGWYRDVWPFSGCWPAAGGSRASGSGDSAGPAVRPPAQRTTSQQVSVNVNVDNAGTATQWRRGESASKWRSDGSSGSSDDWSSQSRTYGGEQTEWHEYGWSDWSRPWQGRGWGQ